MRILVVGATGTIGKAVVQHLGRRHEIISASRTHSSHTVDLTSPDSIAALFQAVGMVDAVVSVAGAAKFGPLDQLKAEDYQFSLSNKLMGQVNLARAAIAHVTDKGSITLTTGVLAWKPMPGSAAISMVNAALEGFAGAAALEAPRSTRVNVVSPPWVTETLQAMHWQLPGGRSAADVAELYAASVEGDASGHVLRFGADGSPESVPLSRR